MKEFCEAIDALTEQPAGACRPDSNLSDLAGWDSMTTMGFMAMAEKKYGVAVSAARLVEATTVRDLASLVGVE